MSKRSCCFSLFGCYRNVAAVFPSDKAAAYSVDARVEQPSASTLRWSGQNTLISERDPDAGIKLSSSRIRSFFSPEAKSDFDSTDERSHSVPLTISSRKVLIVEDVSTNYRVMRRALECYKFPFTILQRNPIRTLAEARIALTGADVIILDNNLAGKDGDNAGLTLFEELVDLWETGERGRFPVICFASNDNAEIKESKINKQTLMARGLTKKQTDSILTCVLYTTDYGATTVKTITRSCRKAIQKALTNRPVYQEEIKNTRCCCIC